MTGAADKLWRAFVGFFPVKFKHVFYIILDIF
jgi:hypothetical protein